MVLSIPAVLLVTTGVSCVGLLLHIIGLATPHWMDDNLIHGGNIASEGLFQMCGRDVCASFPSAKIPDYLRAIQAMIILGMLSAVVSAAMPVIGCWYSLKQNPLPRQLIHICLVAAAATILFTTIGLIIFGIKMFEPTQKQGGKGTRTEEAVLGYSFYLVIVGAVAVLGGSCLFGWAGRSVAEAGDSMIPVA